jgi:class 3 adenylate cyclase
MRCSTCGSENPANKKFCGDCGAVLQRRCPQCGAEKLPGKRFCGDCGSELSDAVYRNRSHRAKKTLPTSMLRTSQPRTKRPKADPGSVVADGERRQLTVMFCDLVGSTAISRQLDPEELRDVIRNYHEICARAIGRFDGFVAKYLGDGLLIYFRYPTAHEDDPQRAVRAGLETLAELEKSSPIAGIQLQARTGIHTGLVVVGEIGFGEQRESTAVLGETPNLAARLQEAAEPGAVVISPATYKLVHGFFECEDRGLRRLKGISEPLQSFRAIAESGARNRFEVAMRSGLTALVGREEEIGLLLRQWEHAQAGHGRAVLRSSHCSRPMSNPGATPPLARWCARRCDCSKGRTGAWHRRSLCGCLGRECLAGKVRTPSVTSMP